MTVPALPDPLVPADVNLQSYDWFPLYHKRLRRSEWWIAASDQAKVISLELWCAAYEEVPAGSLPDSDVAIARLCGIGARHVDEWLAIKAEIMKPWVLCSDGRWYHPTLCEVALDAWARREKEREKEREKKRRQRARQHGDGDEGSAPGDESASPPGTSEKSQQGTMRNVPPGKPTTRQDKTIQKKETSSEVSPPTPDDDDEAIEPVRKAKPPEKAPKVEADEEEVRVGKTGKRGTRLPGDWAPSEKNLEEALELGLDRTQALWVAAKFRDYWSARPGRLGTKLDWDATWRNEVRRELERGSGPNVRGPQGTGSHGRRDPRADAVRNMLEGASQASHRGRGGPGT